MFWQFIIRIKFPLAAFGLYTLYLLLVMHSVFLGGCSTTIFGLPGDNLGFQWLHWASPNSPWWGHTNLTNYPYGENLWQPAYITGQLLYVPYWVLASLAGATCGHNLLIGVGFLFSSTTTFCFLRWLLKYKSFWAPLFGGFTATFTPYLLVKTPVHSSYVFFGILVIIIWIFLSNYQQATLKKAISLGLLIGLLIYHDPYFVLLGGLIILSLILSTLLYERRAADRRLSEKKLIRSLAVAVCIAVVVIMPAIYVRLAYGHEINAFVQNSRGSILEDAQAFSARPWEYVLPESHNPFSPDRLKLAQQRHQHGSNYAENGIYIGLTVMILAVYWLMREARVEKSRRLRHITLFSITLILVAGVLSLPPKVHLHGFSIYLPSYAVISLTEIWRVLSRLYVLVQIGFVILATLGLYRLTQRYPRMKFVLILVCFVGAMIDFAVNIPCWNIHDSHTVIYQTIKNDTSTESIAEYPLRDPPGGTDYNLFLGYQMVHGKKLLNTSLPNSNQKRFRESISNLRVWQSVPVLKSIGIDTVVVHTELNQYLPNIPGLTLLNCSDDYLLRKHACLLHINGDVATQNYALVPEQGFDGPSNFLPIGAEYYMHKTGVLKPVLIKNMVATKTADVAIEYYVFEKSPRKVSIMQQSKVITIIEPSQTKQITKFSINPSYPIEVVPSNPPSEYSFVISNMEIH